jgi:hypothetical protein
MPSSAYNNDDMKIPRPYPHTSLATPDREAAALAGAIQEHLNELGL